MKKLNSKKKKGFTLIELIIVVAILGILAAIAIPKFGDAQRNAKINADISTAKSIANAASLLLAQTSGAISDITKKDIAADDATIGGIKISTKLQGNPVPQAITAGHFYVSVSSDGTVAVFSGTAAADASNLQLYPNPATSYGK